MSLLSPQLTTLLTEAETLNLHGLSFQHITLCETRTWLHYHKIDCAHLNRHMQMGILLHETAYGGEAARPFFGFGINPDCVDQAKKEISEVKKSKSHEFAAVMQLQFYLAVMMQATGEEWTGVLRYPKSRRVKHIQFDEAGLIAAFLSIKQVITRTQPPRKQVLYLCTHCSYRMLCWQESTEDWDFC